MSRILAAAVFIVVALAFSPASNAALYYDYDSINTWLSRNNRTVDGTFDLRPDFTPGEENIIAAGFVFTFIDTDNRVDSVRIDLGEGDMVGHEAINFGFNLFGGRLNVAALIELNRQGYIDYALTFEYGDSFFVKDGLLIADARPISRPAPPPSNRVPDGGSTIALLGLSLLGLGWARTRIASAKNR